MLSCFSCVSLFETPWTVAHQTSLFMGFSSKNTGVGCYSLLQGIFLTQRWNPHLLHCRWILYIHCCISQTYLLEISKHQGHKHIFSKTESFNSECITIGVLVLSQQPPNLILYVLKMYTFLPKAI